MAAERKPMSYLLSALVAAAAGYLALCAIVYFRQSSYVYYPGGDLEVTPAYYDLDYEPAGFRTADGESISAWFVSAEEHPGAQPGPALKTDPRACLLFCHGNAGTMSDRVYTLKVFAELGFDVLIFDYRGYGQSTGKPGEQGTYRDVEAAWRHLVEKHGRDPSSIVVYGRSLGAAVGAWLADRKEVGALVIESAFTSAPDMAAATFPFLPARLLCRFKYDTLSRIDRVDCPVFIAHSSTDEMVPYEHGRKLFSAAREPKRFVRMEGGHNVGGIEKDGEYRRELVEFLSENMAGQ